MTQSVPGNPARTFTVRAEISGRTEVGPTRADNQDAIMIASAVGTASGTRLSWAGEIGAAGVPVAVIRGVDPDWFVPAGTQSGVLNDTPYGFNTRFGEAKGTNPEDLVAAAHAGCFSMALSAKLTEAGHPPETHVAWPLRPTRALLLATPGYLARRASAAHPDRPAACGPFHHLCLQCTPSKRHKLLLS